MTRELAVIGDVHGNSTALTGMLRLLSGWPGLLVFTGDYVNRGPDTAGVIQLLVDLAASGRETYFVAGNHDVAFYDAVTSGDLFPLLSMGGAAAVKSYVEDPKGDVGQQLRELVPQSHIEFLRVLLPLFVCDGLAVTHRWNDPIPDQWSDHYRVHGHTPTADRKPHIGAHSAAIDTGCGLSTDGPLTCFLWPMRTARQVDARGVEITS
jgi:serine/threonine protein phosphatase 1